VPNLDPRSASNIGSDALLVELDLSGPNDMGLKQIEFPAPVHLAFHELELGDLTLGLPQSEK